MMDFIMMTISFTAAILLAGVLCCVIMAQPKVMKMYMKWVQKVMSNMYDEF